MRVFEYEEGTYVYDDITPVARCDNCNFRYRCTDLSSITTPIKTITVCSRCKSVV